jgi:hypothetical protein
MSIATDHALATIASILAPPRATDGKAKPALSEQSAVPTKREAAGYSRIGPGPMAAIRIRWTVRHGDDGYYVDETIGADSVPVVNGPMDGDAAVDFVDARAREAQEGFAALKNEMIGQEPTMPILASGSDEA